MGGSGPNFGEQRRGGDSQPEREPHKRERRENKAFGFAEAGADGARGGARAAIHNGKDEPGQTKKGKKESAEKYGYGNEMTLLERGSHDQEFAEKRAKGRTSGDG